MPIRASTYSAPPLLAGGHRQTLYSSLVRSVDFTYDERERLETPDGDFLDLDWVLADRGPLPRNRSGKVAVLSHGLEGNTQRQYMRGMAQALVRRGWDACAWNLRGCSGELNRQPASYHSGKTEDLGSVVAHVLEHGYERAALVGFSLGGNLTLKYLGEQGAAVDDRLCGAATFSVPVDLEGSSRQIGRLTNWHYTQYFLHSLRQKVRQKAARHPETVSTKPLDYVRTLRAFDDAYTAPLNGFEGATEYYGAASCNTLLSEIGIPTLLVNARDDPFLSETCYPRRVAREHPYLTLEMPERGGHVGFVSFNEQGEYWSERRAASFLATSC